MLSISINWGVAFATATELSFLSRFSIILSLMFAWMFLDRKPSRMDVLSIIIITLGLGLVVTQMESAHFLPALLCILGVSIFQTLRTMIAEIHPESLQAKNIKTRCRVTGYVLLVTSFCLLALTFTGAWFKVALAGNPEAMQGLPFLASMPEWSDVLKKETIYSAVIFGGTVLPFAMYLYFYVAKLVKTEVFMSMIAFLPFFIYLTEKALAAGGFLKPVTIPTDLLLAGVVIVIGAIVMVYGRYQQAENFED